MEKSSKGRGKTQNGVAGVYQQTDAMPIHSRGGDLSMISPS